ncbi:FtsX-like permease family protein [Actinomadura barringtoniae]|uniref:FtsX-like permease family protein n=1 Tax=Actinomadura barringtoniae TaxID=1427535 RepID=A0A939P7J8_9ACTN|nr:FtsX-like permease family protein [Actinomadura barringtoniae]MBO2447237.1 FtsX-like permease family protein [Actinomadura barringtoniae]
MGAHMVVRRLAADRALVLAACATALFATTVLAALAGYAGSVTREGLRRTLADATFESAGAAVSAPVPPGGAAATERKVEGALRDVYRGVPITVSVAVRSDSFTMPGQERREHPELTAFATYTGIEGHARLDAGRWPAKGTSGLEAVLPSAAARAMRLRVGDRVTLHGRVDTSASVRVTVVGLFHPLNADDYIWQGDGLVTTGVERHEYTTYGPFVVGPEAFAQRFTTSGGYLRWRVMPDLTRLDTASMVAVGERVRHGAETFRRLEPGTQFTFESNLPALTVQMHDAVQVARSTMLMPVLQLILLAGYALVLVARLLAGHRRGEVALLRTRGASLRRLGGLTLAEGLLIVLPAAVLGPLLAGPLLRAAGWAPAVRASGLRLDAGPLAPLYAVSIAAALACAFVLTVPTLHAATRPFAEVATGLGRGRRGFLRGSGVEAALLLVAGLALWQLNRYDGGGGGGVDPFIVSGPALALLAGGVVLLRLIPVLSRGAERVTSGGRGLAPVLGARQVSRRPLRYAGPALLLVMATAVGVLSVVTMGTWRLSQADQADFQTGADLRLEVPDGLAGAPAPLGQGGRLATLPGVSSITAVSRQDFTVGTSPGTLLGVDARAFGRVLRVRHGLTRDLDLAGLARSRPETPLLAVPGRPRRVLIGLRLSVPPGAIKPDASFGTFQVSVTIADGRGQFHRVGLPGAIPDGGTRTYAVNAADLAGPGGIITYPLSVRGFGFAYDDNPFFRQLNLEVRSVRGDGTGNATAPAGAGWGAFLDLPGNPAQEVTVTGGGGMPAVTLPDLTNGLDYKSGSGGAVVNVLVSRGTAPVPSEARTPVPGVITRELAQRAEVGVGGTVSIRMSDGDQPVKVIGIVPALPATPPGRPAALVDLPTLAERRLARGDAVDPPREWWASVTGERTAPAAAALAAHREWGQVAGDRVELHRRLRDAPLGAALQGALVMGFGAALAFAVIAFSVNAAVAARERAREFSVLRALGVPERQVAAMLAVEQTFLIAIGLLGGLVLGLAVARLVVPHVVLTVQAAPPYPPAELVVRWPIVLAVLAGVAVLLGLVLAVTVLVLRRNVVAGTLRAGEDR